MSYVFSFNPLPIGDGLPTPPHHRSNQPRSKPVSIPYQSGTGFRPNGFSDAPLAQVGFNPLPIGDGLPTVGRSPCRPPSGLGFQSPTNRGRASDPPADTCCHCPAWVSIPYQSGTGFRPSPISATPGHGTWFQSPTNRGRASDPDTGWLAHCHNPVVFQSPTNRGRASDY